MRIFIIVALLLLQGCTKNILNEKNVLNCFYSNGEKLVVPKKTSFQIFWEWGEVLLSFEDLYLKNGIDPRVVEDAIIKGGSVKDRRPGFCTNNGNMPQRVFLSENEKLNAECIWYMIQMNHYDKYSLIGAYFKDAFLRKAFVDVVDDKYYIFYKGDSLRAEANSSFVHRKLNEDERTRALSLIKADPLEKEEGGEYMYAFIFPLNLSVYSISVWTDSNEFRGYEPLRLDSSVLPLESPDYKELRDTVASRR